MNFSKYIYEDGEFKKANLIDWAIWVELTERRLARTQVGLALVSTVILPLADAFCDGPARRWETMVFNQAVIDAEDSDGEPRDCHKDLPEPLRDVGQRYFTKEQALRGHRIAVELAKEFYPEGPIVETPIEVGKRCEDYDHKAFLMRESFKNHTSP